MFCFEFLLKVVSLSVFMNIRFDFAVVCVSVFLFKEFGSMGSREIKSPQEVIEIPGRLDEHSESFQRKKLGMFFIESDDRRTAFGRGYTGGTTPVNIRGKPIADLSKTGGWIAAFFIFGKPLQNNLVLVFCYYLDLKSQKKRKM